MIGFVLDASVALAWVFRDEYSPYAEYVAEVIDTRSAVVPTVWPLEVVNALLVAVRRGRLLEVDVPFLIDSLHQMRIEIEEVISPEAMTQRTFDVGMAHQLSAYDASYLELAIRRRLPLATEDRRLATAAIAAGVELLQP